MSGERARSRAFMHLGVILDGVGTTAEGWRSPRIPPDASVDIDFYIAQSCKAEEACFDFVFIADSLFITPDVGPHLLNRLEPLTLLAGVAVATDRIGLVATASVLFSEPFTLARQMASLDLVSQGRAAWNVVTSAVAGASLNHSRSADFAVTDRYARAEEHVEVCKALWDSWEPDAFIHDKAAGVFFARDRLHSLDHAGRYYQVAGPLSIQGSKQGRPVIFQAGASHEGRDLAARHGDAIFAMASDMEASKAYAEDVRRRARGFGRRDEDLVFMPRISPIAGSTMREVEERYREACEAVDVDAAIAALELFLGRIDLSAHDRAARFPDLDTRAEALRAPTSRDGILAYVETTSPAAFVARVRSERLTLAEAAQQFMTPRTEFVGLAEDVVEAMARWQQAGAADGFIIRGGDFDMFCRHCVPLLQERGHMRRDYECDTLRGHLGLAVPQNRYAAARALQDGENQDGGKQA